MGRRVIVIEDDEAVYDLIKIGLEEQGCSVTKVSVAAIAETIVTLQDYDLFIVDLGLVGGDGVKVLKAINKAHPDSKDKIVVHTGTQLSLSEQRELKTMCGHVILKGPESIQELLTILD